MRQNLALGIIVVIVLLLQGCGKKGPLTLPKAYSSSGYAVQAEC